MFMYIIMLNINKGISFRNQFQTNNFVDTKNMLCNLRLHVL